MPQNAGPGQPVADLPWIHIDNPESPDLDEIARRENFHELDVEDCRHHGQLAKLVEHEHYSFLVAKRLEFDPSELTLQFRDFNVFITPQRVVTVPESKTDVIEKSVGRLRQQPRPIVVPRIVYTVLDVIVDEYAPALYRIGEEIDQIEDMVLEDPSPKSLQCIFRLRRTLLEFRRNSLLMRDLLNHFLRNHYDHEDPIYPYYRDIYDHLVRTIDGNISRPAHRRVGHLPVIGGQPNQRGDEDPHHLRHGRGADGGDHRRLWHECQDPGRAGALRLLDRHGPSGHQHRDGVVVFPAQRVVVTSAA